MDEHSSKWTPWCWHPWHILPTSITSNRFDFLSNLIFYQNFENFKLVKHTKFSFHGIKKCLLIINESFLNIFPFHEMLLWDHIGLCAWAQEFLLHKTPLNGNGVWWCLPYTHPSQKLRSCSPLKSMFSTRLLLSMVVKAYIDTCPSL